MARSDAVPAPASKPRGCVLLVDDDDALRRAIGKRLLAEGYEVVPAASGEQALALLSAHPIDVVVSDIHMPDMDGIMLLTLLRQANSDLPVILLTAAPEIATAVKAVGLGAFEYMTKPDDFPKLGPAVERAIGVHRDATTKRRLLESASRPRDPASERRMSSREPIHGGELLADRYRIVRLLGSGGMGAVYEAHRVDLAHMRVAIKILHAKLGDRSELLQRFRREAEVVATIDHPNIVKILDFVSPPDGPAFLVMEMLDGCTLSTAIQQEGALSEQRVAFIAWQMLAALAAAHASNVVHRDLKPENVFLTTISATADVVKLLDFGIAKLLTPNGEQKLTETGVVLGTPAYMAPEYARGGAATVAGDVYGVGCVMYEALAGREPFVAENYNALLFAIQEQRPPPIGEVRSDLSPELVQIVERAMAKDVGSRFPSAQSMADALAPWVSDTLAQGRPSTAAIIASAPTEEQRPGRT
jgi:CheY-like chemotaxis protein/tRNA A-37 threonylcarbamoyl transferase component Bud32